MSKDINQTDLSALLDGELPSERRAEVEALIKADPDSAARLDAYRADKEMLRRLFEPVARRPIPSRWVAIANGARPRPRRSFRMVGSIAAALLLAVFGAATYVELRPPVAVGIAEEALAARGQATAPEKVFAVEQGAGLNRYSSVLQSAVGARIKVPDMGRMGYRLASIRVYSAGAAEMAYRDQKNSVVTVYVRRVRNSDGGPQFYQFGRDGLRVCVWQDDRIATVISGNVSTAAMQRLADVAVYGLFL